MALQKKTTKKKQNKLKTAAFSPNFLMRTFFGKTQIMQAKFRTIHRNLYEKLCLSTKFSQRY